MMAARAVWNSEELTRDFQILKLSNSEIFKFFLFFFSTPKVYFGDILQDEGKQLEDELQSKYGKENVTFVACDVTKEDDIKGKPISLINLNLFNRHFGDRPRK